MSYQTPNSYEELLQRWHKRLRESQFAHYEVADTLSRRNVYLGIPVVILSAVVATSFFSSLNTNDSLRPELKIGMAFISIVAAVLASLQTFLKFSERAEKHRSVAARYGTIRREVEQFLITAGSYQGNLNEPIDGIRVKIDSLAAEAPEISARTFQRIQAKLNTT